MRISDWSSDVCSSDLGGENPARLGTVDGVQNLAHLFGCLLATHADSFSWNRRRLKKSLVHVKFLAPDVFYWRASGRSSENRRSEERRVGKECGSTCRSRGSP